MQLSQRDRVPFQHVNIVVLYLERKRSQFPLLRFSNAKVVELRADVSKFENPLSWSANSFFPWSEFWLIRLIRCTLKCFCDWKVRRKTDIFQDTRRILKTVDQPNATSRNVQRTWSSLITRSYTRSDNSHADRSARSTVSRIASHCYVSPIFQRDAE